MAHALQPAEILSLPPEARAFARLEDYFGHWAMMEDRFLAGFEMVRGTDLVAHIRERASVVQVAGDIHVHQGQPQAALVSGGQRNEENRYLVANGVAIIDIAGTLMKHASSFSESSSTVGIRRKLRAAANDASVRAIMLVIDSPGGTVAGTKELADEVAAVAKVKRVHAYVEDLCASAAYWVGSQAAYVSASDTSLVGSIGTYGVVYDFAKAFDEGGVKVHVVRAGAFKGAGVPGTPVTDEQLAEAQRIINGLNSHFLAGVESGRKLAPKQVAELADGRVHIAADAKGLRLIDAVESFDAALARLQSQSTSNPSGARSMSVNPTQTETTPTAPAAPKAATSAEIRAACPGASPAFILAQLDAGATISAAQTAFITEQQTALAAARKETEEAKAAAPVAKKPGLPPVPDRPSSSANTGGDGVAAFEQAVTDRMNDRKIPREQAHRQIMREQPELREAYVAGFNAQHAQKKRSA